MPTLQQLNSSQVSPEIPLNENFESIEHQAVYSKRHPATSGLVWGYYGGRWGGFAVTAGTFTLTASSANHIVVALATGVTTCTAAATNWNNSAAYARVYKLTTSATAVTAVEDHRVGPGGVQGGSGATGTVAFTGGTLTSALNEAPTVTIASAASVAIGAAAGNTISVTGVVTITAFDTLAAGAMRRVVFAGALTLTHNATSLILPSATNITTAAGDAAEFLSLGAGNWRCTSYQKASGTAVVSSGGGLTNFTDTLGSAAPNATTPVSTLTATNAATNVDVAVVPKGSGALLAAVPDNATTGGNKRGINAVDLQTATRSAADKVASGAYAVITGGLHNKASNNHCVIVGGTNNTASGDNSAALCGASNSALAANSYVLSGRNNTANGNDAVIGGGYLNTLGGSFTCVPGGRENDITHTGSIGSGWGSKSLNDGTSAFAAYYFAVKGDAQSLLCVVRAGTTNATATALTTDQGALTAGNQLTLENNSSMNVKGLCVARQNTTGDTRSWEFTAHIKRGASAAATSMVATCTPTSIANDAGAATWALSVTADTTRGALTVTFTGEAAKTIRTVCSLSAAYVQG